MNWKKLCFKLSLTFENKMVSSHSKNADILNLTKMIEIFHFPQLQELVNKLGKNILFMDRHPQTFQES